MIQTWASVQASACAGRSLNCLFNGWIRLTLISPNWPLSMNINWAFSFPKIINQESNWECKKNRTNKSNNSCSIPIWISWRFRHTKFSWLRKITLIWINTIIIQTNTNKNKNFNWKIKTNFISRCISS
jgi:hypothetical protein